MLEKTANPKIQGICEVFQVGGAEIVRDRRYVDLVGVFRQLGTEIDIRNTGAVQLIYDENKAGSPDEINPGDLIEYQGYLKYDSGDLVVHCQSVIRLAMKPKDGKGTTYETDKEYSF